MRQRIFISLAILIATGCPGPVDPNDGGTDNDGGLDGSTDRCARHSDCGDQELFCARWRCEPGTPGADPRGCVDLGPRCEAGQECDEDADACGQPAWCTEGKDGCLAPGDCDGDGSPNQLECGGDDCDDDDPNRKPGNVEVCDAAGHDEDCNLETFAGADDGDLDGDGFISAMCCNGDACGNDCDDSDINVNPSAAEVCDGIDNDCSGVADDASGLCPGGLCVAGRCDFDAWDRAWGSTLSDTAPAVAHDAAGAIYVAGVIRSSVDFGAGPRSFSGGSFALYIAKYLADGTPDWQYVSPGGTNIFVEDLAVSPSGAHVYIVGKASGVDFGSGSTSSAFLLHVDGAGAYLSDHRFGTSLVGDALNGVAADEAGVVIAGSFTGTHDFGGGEETASGSGSMVLARYDSTGAHVWSRVFHATGTAPGRRAAATALDVRDGNIFVGGYYRSGGLTLDPTLPAVPADQVMTFVAWIDATGTPTRAREQGSGGSVIIEAVSIGPSGRGYAVGHYSGPWVPAGAIDPTRFGGSDLNGYIAGYEADGTPEWARSFGGDGGQDTAYGVATDGAGSVYVAGDFSVRTSFGGSTRVPVLRDGFLAKYTATGTHQSDTQYASGGTTAVRDVSVGPGNSVAIVGEFVGRAQFGGGTSVSNGGADVFLLRLGS